MKEGFLWESDLPWASYFVALRANSFPVVPVPERSFENYESQSRGIPNQERSCR
jgi:hypothetical protein